MAYLALWLEWLHVGVLGWMKPETLAGSTLRGNCIRFLHRHCCDPLHSPHPVAPFSLCCHVHHIVFLVIFILCYFLSSRRLTVYLCFFPSALPPLLCQHFTVDIQLLAGHSIVIPFRAAPFSAGLKQPFKLHPWPPSELPLCKMLFSNISGATT